MNMGGGDEERRSEQHDKLEVLKWSVERLSKRTERRAAAPTVTRRKVKTEWEESGKSI